MPRNMVIGKLKYLVGPWRGTYHPTVFEHCTLFSYGQHAGAESAYSVVEGGGPVPQHEKKGEKLCGCPSAPYVCVRFPWPG